ncbi:MAG: hypothetical protein HYW05_03295 [Candidatus Diapherotrites archaeon]|nr:hypothetical protein [Candidatus Diapherotrites archaeon]
MPTGSSPILPQFGSKAGSTKDAIISILSEEWPLTAKQIYNKLRRQQAIGISYQAVHKTLNTLQSHRIIASQGMAYLLDNEWIKNIKEFSEHLETAYALNEPQNPNANPLNLMFNSVYDVDKFLIGFGKKEISGKKEVLCLHWTHFWIPLFMFMEEYRQMNEILAACNTYSITRGNTAIDRQFCNFWRKKGIHAKCGVDSASTIDMVIYKDIVAEVFYPQAIKYEIDKVYERASGANDIDADGFFRNVFEKKVRIPVVINRNKGLAQFLKKQTLSYFRKGE